MTTQNGTITGVTLLEGSFGGLIATVSSTNYTRKVYHLSVDFPAYTGSSDTMTVTGVNTAIAAATRNGRTLTLRAAVPGQPGQDTTAQAVFAAGTSIQAMAVSNGTTTGDLAGNLTDAAGTELTSTTAVSGVGIIAVVDET